MKTTQKREAWNSKLIGPKQPLKPKDVWAIRFHLQTGNAIRDLAMFNLAIDSKLRGCDLVGLLVRDVAHGTQILPRAMVIQSNNAASYPIRVDRANESCCGCLDRKGTSTQRAASFPQSDCKITSYFDATICPTST